MENAEEVLRPRACLTALSSGRICHAIPGCQLDLATRYADVLQHVIRHFVQLSSAAPYPAYAVHGTHSPADHVQDGTDCRRCACDCVHGQLSPTMSGANCRAIRDRLWALSVGAIVCVGVEKALFTRKTLSHPP
jgi:hypothetical protein